MAVNVQTCCLTTSPNNIAESDFHQKAMSNPVVEGAVKLNVSTLAQATPDGGRSERARPGENSQSDRSVQRICFEEYLEAWLKLATTGSRMSMRDLTLEKLMKYQEAFAMDYGSQNNKPSEMTHCHNITEGSLYKQPDKLKKTCTKKDRRLERLKRMKSIYLLYRNPDQQESEWGELPASRGRRADRDTQECWETEVDTLVAWTHTLSVKEMEGE